MTSISSNLLFGGLLVLGAGFGFASDAHAQGTIQNSYGAPEWGQQGGAKWGSQSGQIGQQGWQYGTGPQTNQPAGNSAYPNASTRPFGAQSDTDNPMTSRGRR